MGCCRGSRPAQVAKTYDSSLCTNCKEELMELFKAAAAYQTRGGQGTGTVIPKVNCPKCNAVNQFKINIERRIERSPKR